VDEAVGVGEVDGVGVGVVVVVGVGLGVGVVDGEGDAVGVVVGVVDGEGEWVGVAEEEVPWAGPTRLGGWTAWLPVKRRAMAAIATPRTATAPPVATPAAKEWRSRRYSVRRR
jgi:hypothetical protein